MRPAAIKPASVPWFATWPFLSRTTSAGTAGFASERRRFAGRRSGVGDGSVSESESSSAAARAGAGAGAGLGAAARSALMWHGFTLPS